MQHQAGSQHEIPTDDPARWQLMPSVSPHMKALNVEVLHCLYLHARNSRKHNASDGYAAAIWLVVVRKVCEQDAYRQYRVKHQQPRTWGTAQVLW